MRKLFHFQLLTCGFAGVVLASPLTQLTPEEVANAASRLKAFRSGVPSALNLPSPKFSVTRGQYVNPHPELRLPAGSPVSKNALTQQAQVKATAKFQKHECEKFRSKYFRIACERGEFRADIKPNDRVEDLAYSWVPQVNYDLSAIPVKGESDRPLWSDDYWRTQWGLTSYRYGEGKTFTNYKEAIASYLQPQQWAGIANLSLEEISAASLKWSPAEKYDLTVGDTSFSLTREQKEEGQGSLGPDGNVEEWMGICHGWAPASMMVDRPMKAIKVTGVKGLQVDWYPGDIKAMATLAWASGNYQSGFIGGRCNAKNPKTFPNGRLSQPNCFDNNPATFHLALGNMIGIGKGSFVMDKTFDYEVWNQPVVSYEFEYFNPLNPSKKSSNWKEVAIPYDDTFKRNDRFQKPLTRGSAVAPAWLRPVFKNGDEHIKQIVGVRAVVAYVSEITPEHTPNPEEDDIEREVYLYDLEIAEDDGKPIVTGGEWYQNNHPDFLYAPRRHSYVSSEYDSIAGEFDGVNVPTELFTKTAAEASAGSAYPLCKVLRELVKRSAGSDVSVQCE